MWKKRILGLVITTILVLSVVSIITIDKAEGSDGTTFYVGGSGPGNYTAIQSAIDDASDGDTVFVYSGTYYENLIVDKEILLIGQDKNSTIIDGNMQSDAITLIENNVTVKNFLIKNSGQVSEVYSGISIQSSGNNICNNKISGGNYCGIIITKKIQPLPTTFNELVFFLDTPQKVIDYMDITFSYKYHDGCISYLPSVFYKIKKGDCKDYATFFSYIIDQNDYYAKMVTFDGYDHHNSRFGHVVTLFEDDGYLKYQSNDEIYGPVSSVADILDKEKNRLNAKKISSYKVLSPGSIDCCCHCHNDENYNLIYTPIGANLSIVDDYTISNTNIFNNTISNNIIEGLPDIKYGIYVNSSNNNIIEKNWCSNTGNGIYLFSSSGNTIKENVCTENNFHGIYIEQSNDNIIRNNTCIHNMGNGLWIDSSSYNLVENNNCTDNQFWTGIYVFNQAHNNIIFNNTCSENLEVGIAIRGSLDNHITCNYCKKNPISGIYLDYSEDNIIDNNTCIDNELYGIELHDNSNHNIVQNNTCHGNLDCGIRIYSSDENSMIDNLCENNKYGIDLDGSCYNNKIFHNILIANTQNAYDDGLNTWDNGYLSGGNYWSDFDEPSEGAYDNNDDGIIDTYYYVPGGNNKDRYPLILNNPPNCSLFAIITSGFSPLNISFFINASDSDGLIISWTLDIDNDEIPDYNNSGNLPFSLNHTYQNIGTFIAKLEVVDDKGATTFDTVIINVVNRIPIPDFTFSPLNPTRIDAMSFTDCSIDYDGTIVNWTWNFGDGTISYGQNQTHQFLMIGEYEVTLTVIDNYNSTNFSTQTITIKNIIPKADYTFSPATPLEDGMVSFDASLSYDKDGIINQYEWDWDNDGIYDDNGISTNHSWSTRGSYLVKLRVTDNDYETNTKTTTINVTSLNEKPLASFTYQPLEPSDLQPIVFTDNSYDTDGTIVSYHWSFGDGTTSDENNPTHQYTDNGTYTLRLTVTDDDGESNTKTMSIFVKNVPPMAAYRIEPSSSVKTDTVVEFIDNSTDLDGSIVNWTWNFGEGTIVYGNHVNHSFPEEGVYNITLTVQDNDNEIATKIISLVIEVEKDNDGAPGFEFILLTISIISLLFITKRKRNHG